MKKSIEFDMYGFTRKMQVAKPFPKVLMLNIRPMRELIKGEEGADWIVPFFLVKRPEGKEIYQIANDIDVLVSVETQLKIRDDIDALKREYEKKKQEQKNTVLPFSK
jgi:hypothetical protein